VTYSTVREPLSCDIGQIR